MRQSFLHVTDNIDVKPLLEELAMYPELWDEITLRQNFKGSPHRDTKAIFLRMCKSAEGAFTDTVAVDYPALSKLPAARVIIDRVRYLVGGSEIGRVMLAELFAGGIIDQHTDEGAYADYYDRFHVVIASESGNAFHCGGSVELMRVGELFWFNHKLPHFVVNDSDEPRIHMIIDLVAAPFFREMR